MQKARRCVSSTFFSQEEFVSTSNGGTSLNHQPHHVEDNKRPRRRIKGCCNTGESESLWFTVAVWGRAMPVGYKWLLGLRGCVGGGGASLASETETRSFARSQLGRGREQKKRGDKIDREGTFVVRGLCVCCESREATQNIFIHNQKALFLTRPLHV